MARRRWLLDQNVPKPRFDADQLDARVEYVHLSDFNPVFSRTSTPDWLVHLAAADAGYDGVVSTDPSQLDQDEEAITLTATRLTVVTWTRRIDDPVVLWGSLISFMPEVLTRLEQQGPCVVTLPVPRISAARVEKTGGVGGRVAASRRTSLRELRAEVVPDMRAELAERGLEHLSRFFD